MVRIMTSEPVWTSTADGHRDKREIAGLRVIPQPKPRAPRKAPVKRDITTEITCFCGERFQLAQAKEFMLHLRAEVGEVLDWKENLRKSQRASHKRYREKPEIRERSKQWQREYRGKPQIRERIAEQRREREAVNPELRERKRARDRLRYSTPEYRERRREYDRARYARMKAEREAANDT